MARKRLFTVETPVPEARVVSLYEDTWDSHVILHEEMVGHIAVVERTLIAPTWVYEGNRSDSFEFISDQPAAPLLTPLVVIVSGDHKGELSVTTAFKGRQKHLVPGNKKVRWPR